MGGGRGRGLSHVTGSPDGHVGDAHEVIQDHLTVHIKRLTRSPEFKHGSLQLGEVVSSGPLNVLCTVKGVSVQ